MDAGTTELATESTVEELDCVTGGEETIMRSRAGAIPAMMVCHSFGFGVWATATGHGLYFPIAEAIGGVGQVVPPFFFR